MTQAPTLDAAHSLRDAIRARAVYWTLALVSILAELTVYAAGGRRLLGLMVH
jgi:hypothetical protein